MANPYAQFVSSEPAAPPSAEDNPYRQFTQPAADISRAPDGVPRITVRPAGTTAEEPKPTTTGGQAFGRGILNAATFNFYDELNGLARAGGLDPEDPDVANAIKSLFVGGYRKFKGDAEAEKLYAEERDKRRAETKALEEEHPGASLAGNVVGGLAVPVGAAAQAATLPARIGRGAIAGAGIGAVSGAGEAPTTQEIPGRVVSGGAVGAGLGAVAPPLIEGAIKGGSALISAPINQIRAAINPQATAERAVGRAYSEAVRADPNAANRLRPSELTPGGPAVAMDVLGGPGRNLARSSGNISGEARDVLSQTLDPRFEEQVPRFVGWLRSTTHYPDVHAQEQAIEKVAKTVNNVAYERAKREGAGGIWNAELSEMSQAPALQDAVKAATKQAQNRSAPDVSKGQEAIQRRWVSSEGKPTLEFWDLVKRQVDQEINVAKRAGKDVDAAELTAIKNRLVEHLDAAVPSYSTARQGAAKFFGAENALEAGQKFVTENFSIPQTRAALAKMSPLERQLFQDGFASRYAEILSKVPDRADVVRKIYNTPEAREKFVIALGPERAKEMEAMLRVENIMQQGLRAVQGNSTTAMQLIGAGLAGAGGGGFLGFDPTTSGLAAALATAGKKGIDARVANKVAELLTSSDPAALRRAATMIANSDRLMRVVRSIDNGAVKTGGQQAPSIAGINAGRVGRADEDQPQVQRPPGQ